jgi:hypothetical protein
MKYQSPSFPVILVRNLPPVTAAEVNVDVTSEVNVDQVFSRTGQLSEVNLDPDSFDDMVSVMVNKFTHKTFVNDIMDKYYEMFPDNNQSETKKKDLSNSPDSPDHSDQDSDTAG